MNKLITLSMLALACIVSLARGYYYAMPYGGSGGMSYGYSSGGGFMEFFFMRKTTVVSSLL